MNVKVHRDAHTRRKCHKIKNKMPLITTSKTVVSQRSLILALQAHQPTQGTLILHGYLKQFNPIRQGSTIFM